MRHGRASRLAPLNQQSAFVVGEKKHYTSMTDDAVDASVAANDDDDDDGWKSEPSYAANVAWVRYNSDCPANTTML